MAVAVFSKPNSHIVRSPNGDQNLWRSISADPAFKIVLPTVRPRFLAVFISSRSGDIEPKVYFNSGLGFSEKNSRPCAIGKDFIILLDVGPVGSRFPARIDPLDSEGEFFFEASAFATRQILHDWIEARTRANPGIIVQNFGKSLMGIKVAWRHRDAYCTVTARDYCTALYSYAAKIQIPLEPSLQSEPWLSIVTPTHNTPIEYLSDLLKSFLEQECNGVEIILSDDGSTESRTQRYLESVCSNANVRVVRCKENKGISAATNAGLANARGKWVTFLDHDDLIAPHALKVIKSAIELHPDANFFYTDELIVDRNLRASGLMLKPAFDRVLLTGVNYINHFSIYKRDLVEQIGALRSPFDGSQDYDLLLRYLNLLEDNEVRHIPFPAYWWRQTGESYSAKYLERATQNARRAIAESLAAPDSIPTVGPALTETLHRVEFGECSAAHSKISIIIPSRDNFRLISRILDDIYNKTDYSNFEVIVVDNGSQDSKVLELYQRYTSRESNFFALVNAADFNFSRAVNLGMAKASGEHYLLLNNDLEVLDRSWLKELVTCLEFAETGIVGAKLVYPNGRLQHAGVIVGYGGLAGHWFINKARDFGGPMNRLHLRNSVSCVTGAVMLISHDCAKAVGAWDEVNFPIAYNDVDYCLRAKKAGFRIVWTPFASLIHHESVSRGSDEEPTRKARFHREQENLRRLHQTSNYADRTTHEGYSTDRSEPRLILPKDLLPVR